jgi:hypothetical protein
MNFSTVMKPVSPMAALTACLFILTSVEINAEGLAEIRSNVAIADEQLTFRIKNRLNAATDGAWTPDPQVVLKALILANSEPAKRVIISKSPPGMPMDISLSRLDKSRFQVFGLLIDRRPHLLIDATPLDSDAPELWLKDCISHHVFDGGPAYWWLLIDAGSMEIRSCGRRP